jgi:hypothetical protein
MFSHQKRKGQKPYDPPKEASKEDATNEKKGPKCMHCKKYGHIRRECDEFKAWLAKKGNDFISFIDESFFTDFSSNTWWIDSGVTVHQLIHLRGYLASGPKEGREAFKWLMGVRRRLKPSGHSPYFFMVALPYI